MATTPTRKKRSTRYTPEQTAAWRADQRTLRKDQITNAARELLTTEGWQRWVRCRAKMNRYSANNLALIVMQCPHASKVAKYGDWAEFGRHVIKGEHPLRIWAPLFRKPTREEIAAGHPPEKKILYSFKGVGVFDVSQTDGEPLPTVETESIEGDSHEWALEPLIMLALELGYSVESMDAAKMPPSVGGFCDPKRKRIVVMDGVHVNAAVRVLVHEIAHALGIGYESHTREQAEVLVECVTFVVCGGIGLDTSGESVAYVASWGQDDEVAAIEAFAQLVDQTARRIEAALSDAQDAS